MTKQIAIVGMACRFPGHVESPDDFWALLRDEKDAVTQVPADRFGTEFYQHPSKREAGKSYTFSAGVLDDVAGFDAAFFGISPREAQQMDPQQRLLLELAWETFEDAGVRPRDMEGSNCAVYIGVASPDYGNRFVDDLNAVDPYSATGNTLSIASNRLSYLFDLRGPSVSVDTACSSSLVALHQACQALQSGDAEMALAGGVNLLLHPFGFVTFSKASMLSPRGRCRAFDATGDGYVRSEGGALVMLKTLDRALADGDTIHAVIAGSGVNSDGYSQGGISVPGAATQAALLRTVYERAGVDPRSLAYVEAHGTGTAVGDPIEARALIEVASAGRPVDRPLLIGSVKTNVGHLETASGMAGLMKAILCLKHRAVPKTLHFETPNPAIDFVGGRLRVVDRLTPLGSGAEPLVIGVNSFGFGGTNAHIVLREAPKAPVAPVADTTVRAEFDSKAPSPLILSTRTAAALPALAARYMSMLDNGAPWSTLASNAAHHRQWLKHRAIIAPSTPAEARAALAALATPTSDQTDAALVQGETPGDDTRLALVFSGNGSQWAGMGKQLLEQEPVFRAALDELDALWRADGSASLVGVLREGVSAATLEATEHAQPLLFAIQVGAVRVIEARGVGYDVCLGHSVGEVAAAWASGALTLAQAVRVIKIRSRAQARTRGTGRMAAAGLGEAAMRALMAQLGVDTAVEVAGVNSPHAVTLAGPLGALQVLEAAVKESGRFFQMLDLDYAFHSRQMDPIEPSVLQGLADLVPNAASRSFVSTVTGTELAGNELDAQYWWRNIREPVRFGDAVAQVAQTGVRLFLEVGPHSILRTYVTQTLDDARITGRSLPTLKRNHDSAQMLHHAIYAMLANGARVDVERFAPTSARVALPSYPWQHERYWLGPTAEAYNLVNRRREHPLLGYRLREHALAWENQLDPAGLPMLADHVVDGGVAFPGAGYVEMALAAARAHFGTQSCAVENLEIRLPVVFQPQHSKLFRFTVDVRTASFTIETRDRMSDEAWSLNVTGRLLASGCALSTEGEADALPATTLTELFAQPAMSGTTLYANTTAIGLSYGPAFQWVRTVHVDANAGVALAEVEVPAVLAQAESGSEPSAYALHPALMDSGFHPLFALLASADQAEVEHAAYVPVQIGRIDYLRGDAIRYVVARIERRSPHSVVASFEFADAHGAIVARLGACRFRRVDLMGRRQHAPARYAYIVEAKPLAADLDARMLPEPAALLEAAAAALAAQEDQPRRQAHLTEMLPLLDVLASAYALNALDAIDVFAQPSLPDCAHPALLARLVQIVVEDGLAQRDGTRLVRDAVACENLPGIDELWRDLLAQSPAHVAELTLLAHCGAALPAVLRGEVSGAQILPPSRSSLVEHFFEASPTWAHVNALTGACLHRAIEGWSESRRLRVLELDSPSSDVLQPLAIHVPVSRCDYTIAGTHEQLSGFDASEHPSVRIANIEFGDAPRLSGIEAGERYDIVVASHVLAAQAEPCALLNALRGWLAPGALVVIAEPRNSRFADIVFDLDADAAHANARRAAWLSPVALTKHLEEAGFEQVARHTEQGLDLEGAPTLIVAREPHSGATPGNESEAQTPSAHWSLLYAAETGVDETLAAALRAAGHTTSSNTLKALRHDMSKLAVPAERAHHIVFIAPDHTLSADADGAEVMHVQQRTTLALAQLVRDLTVAAGVIQPQLWIVTRGGAPVATPFADAATLRPEQAAMWGLGRVLANEHPELSCRLIDVSPACRDAGVQLARELLASDGEEEVLLTAHGRYVPRMLSAASAALRSKSTASVRPQSEAAVLGFASPGSLRNLEWFALPQRELAADEVEIEPVATGLNFRDVMYAMGLLSDEAVENGFAGATIGMELSGRVSRVGRDVQRFAPGDAVLGFAPASFASHVRTKAEAIARKPERLTFEEAATVPTTFFTAYYALSELARLRRGERVLVHGAAGGVGIAAIQLARHLGAEVFATAGSREKREFVRLLGADHVFDSRSLAFADEIRERTRGAGVDIVLNSLAGEAMVRSIDTLRPFGRFLELGKRDFYENSRIGLRPFRNNISYFGIDADQLMNALPDLTSCLFEEVMQLFTRGVLHPLPYRAFPAERVEEAFRHMQQARQIGKILVTYPAGTPSPSRATAGAEALQLDPAAAYLIVGGTGGLGFATARWMMSRGARHLTLASRSGVLVPELTAEAARWREENGTQVHTAACDVTNAAALDALLSDIAARGTPLKGVLHSAMVIDDSLVRNLDDARFAAVLAPKLAGAWNLHRATRAAKLDFFVVYSSATTFLGNPGQSSYVAANSFLEALIAQRRAAGLPGTYMAWGPLDDVGFLARNAETREALQARIGGLSITSAEALAALERAIVDMNAGEAIVRLDWQALSLGMPAARARRYTELHARGSHEPARQGGAQMRDQILGLAFADALQMVEETLQAQIARILHMSPEKIEAGRSILDMGMDSLMGMELGMAVEESFQVKLSIMTMAEGATVRSLAQRIVESIQTQDDVAEPNGVAAQVAAVAAQHALDVGAHALADVADALSGQADTATPVPTPAATELV
ncbi:L-threonine 3-dehydrogenase [Paraburkholderia aspalathi]|uniref:L-threonine 3-dehydrogenase n=1 Tax=Paraburkholderia aspalathi TaxID=1324617 RepID=A0ABM8SMK7_9BURK|nr:type I polyketide synthase [Paraburkholderia aspalathi]MBK3822138.1 SDR family NAD(P)-dependent oxidoreductase [Paraburkholderia aspalathi]MBK3833972.1 SDR family NAD(P)-dependent oxidoreductase [Paraburkholderia aspalathi]MBK3863695.1 SDR family NAD(P)-dependent oxidoreductase [Paraburkholderia aspalathi]CAE6820444.1 L-threonine 3-dehydrogenase [Paraburkholderia aspalathi]